MSDDPWLTEISPADIQAAVQRRAAREALIAEQAAEITRLRARAEESKKGRRNRHRKFMSNDDWVQRERGRD